MYWASSCGGCEISTLNIGEHILAVDEVFDLAFFPCIADFKVEDVEGLRGRLHRCMPVQRRHPQLGKRGDGPAAAAQIEGAGGLWLLRLRGLHPRPLEPDLQAGDALRPSSWTIPPSTTRPASCRKPAPRCPKASWKSPSSTTRSNRWIRWWMWITTSPAARPNRTRFGRCCKWWWRL